MIPAAIAFDDLGSPGLRRLSIAGISLPVQLGSANGEGSHSPEGKVTGVTGYANSDRRGLSEPPLLTIRTLLPSPRV